MSGKELTKHQQKLRSQHRCIYCGQKAKLWLDRENNEHYDDECSDCWKMQHRQSDIRDYGSATASVQHEFARRLRVPLRGIRQEDEDE